MNLRLALAFMRASDCIRIHQQLGLPVPIGLESQAHYLRLELDGQQAPHRRPA